MIGNNLKIAFRHLKRSKLFSLINILGLSVGISAFAFIALYISFEMSFDRFHKNGDNIYRIGSKRYSNGELVETSAKTFPGVRKLLKDNFPEVKDVTGFYKTPANTGFLFRHNGVIYNESGGWFNSDSSFFNVFPTLLSKGDAETVLKEPNSLILSERLARKIFGEENPIGQTLDRVDDHTDGSNYTVRGILKDIPSNSHFHVSIIEHIHDSWPESDVELWGEGRLSTYVAFSNDVQPDLVEAKLNALLRTLEPENILVKDTKVFLQPITEIHLSSKCQDDLEANGNKTLLYVLGGIGLIILLIAWINYVNLETSRFVLRIKEFGIRRIIGSRKSNLIVQFLSEYFLLTMGALLFSALIIIYALPYYSSLINISVHHIMGWDLTVWGIALVFFLVGSIAVGIYPAIFLLKFNPVLAIKGKVSETKSGSKIRQALVVTQFTASIVLIACVLTVDKQLDFMKLLNKGVELETVIAIRNPTAYSNQELTDKYGEFEAIENRLLQYPAVRSVASSSAIPGTEIGFSYVNLIKRNLGDPYDATVYKTMFVSSDFISTYHIDLLEGQTFSTPANFNGESPWETENWSSVILNESAIYQLGFKSPAEAVNQEVYFQPFDDFIKCKIIGVIKDYHHEAVKKEVFPTILFNNYASYQQVFYSIGLNAGSNPSETLKQIEKVWKASFPDRPFEYFFLDEYYDRQFKSETQFQSVFVLFASTAILIACLGVLGMTLFEMNTRLKEISIRKVLGASVFGLLLLLSRTNVRLILISFGLAIPLIYYFTKEWLDNYPAKIEFTPLLTFIPLFIVALMVTLVSGIQTIKAAGSNPIDHLKNE
jgi:putative ABC transport system permease protein